MAVRFLGALVAAVSPLSWRSASRRLLSAVLLAGSTGWASAQDVETPNTGQDITNPVTRFDFRLGYQRTPAARDSTSIVLRGDRPVPINGDWKLGLRVDAPVLFGNSPSSDNPRGSYRIGLGDALVQAVLIHPIDKRQAFGFGAQVIFPTASQDQFGSGHVRVLPTIGYRYTLPEISPGSFFVGAIRYDFDAWGAAGRKHVSNLQFGPTLNVALPQQMFLTLWPSTDIRYDFLAKSWFVPFDVQIGKLWGKSVVTSLEVSVPIYRGDAPLYKYRVEGRVGVFF